MSYNDNELTGAQFHLNQFESTLKYSGVLWVSGTWGKKLNQHPFPDFFHENFQNG